MARENAGRPPSRKRQLDRARRRLLALRRELEGASRFAHDAPGVQDEADMANLSQDREMTGHTADLICHTLVQIDCALARVEDGSYGICEDCGQEIPAARLEALPSATLCVGCKAEREAEDATLPFAPQTPWPTASEKWLPAAEEDDEPLHDLPAVPGATPRAPSVRLAEG